MQTAREQEYGLLVSIEQDNKTARSARMIYTDEDIEQLYNQIKLEPLNDETK